VVALDAHNDEAESLLRTIETETRARDAIAQALRLGDEERDDDARAMLLRVADTSVFAGERDRLRHTLEERAAQRSLHAIDALLADKKLDAALAALEVHLAHWPHDEAALALQQRLRILKAQGPAGDPALTDARAAFARGDVARARALASSTGAASYVADLDRFMGSLNRGRAALAQKDGERAKPDLDDAYSLLGGLGAGPGSTSLVQKPLADALYLSATHKLTSSDPCGGARDLFHAAQVMPSDPKIQSMLQTLDGRAQQGLVEARADQLGDKSRAAFTAKKALCFARPGSSVASELHTIARE
jgi:hypothetical protein